MAIVSPQEKLLTAEEFYDLPDDDEIPYELVDGRLEPKFVDEEGTPMTGASFRHGVVCLRLASQVLAHVTSRRLGLVSDGQTTFLLRRKPDVVRAPDVAYVAWHRFPDRQAPKGRLAIAPDFAAEVISPFDRASQRQRKMLAYLDAGVRLAWLVDPDAETVTEYAPDRPVRVYETHDTLDGGEVVPGLRIAVAPLFEFGAPDDL